jgi:hypothetical protein
VSNWKIPPFSLVVVGSGGECFKGGTGKNGNIGKMVVELETPLLLVLFFIHNPCRSGFQVLF